jgi:hypothetical protein
MVIKNKIELTDFKDEIQKDYIITNFKFRYLQDFNFHINEIVLKFNDIKKYKREIPQEMISFIENKCLPIQEYMNKLETK